MTPADRFWKLSMPRFVSLIGQRVRRLIPFPGPARQSPVTAPAPSQLATDLGGPGIAQVVHDLRNYLMVMIACADRVARLVPEGRGDQDVTELQRCAEQASLLSRALLVAARPRLTESDRVDLNQVVAHASIALEKILGDTIQLRVRVPAETVMVRAEATELERILLNLALNARAAMEQGGILTIETALVQDVPDTTGADRPGHVRLTVSDTGCGMTPEIQARIFEPFFTTKPSGSGLGMTSVAFTVRRLEGTVSVDSHPGRGTSVTVQLPHWP